VCHVICLPELSLREFKSHEEGMCGFVRVDLMKPERGDGNRQDGDTRVHRWWWNNVSQLINCGNNEGAGRNVFVKGKDHVLLERAIQS